MWSTPVFPLINRWQEDASRDAGNLADVQFSLQAILDIRDKVSLVQLIAGTSSQSRRFLAEQQCASTVGQTTWRCCDAFDNVWMASFDALVPTTIAGAAHGATLVFVNVFGALGISGNVFPTGIFEVVGDSDDL